MRKNEVFMTPYAQSLRNPGSRSSSGLLQTSSVLVRVPKLIFFGAGGALQGGCV
jgi:hypothetical protein